MLLTGHIKNKKKNMPKTQNTGCTEHRFVSLCFVCILLLKSEIHILQVKLYFLLLDCQTYDFLSLLLPRAAFFNLSLTGREKNEHTAFLKHTWLGFTLPWSIPQRGTQWCVCKVMPGLTKYRVCVCVWKSFIDEATDICLSSLFNVPLKIYICSFAISRGFIASVLQVSVSFPATAQQCEPVHDISSHLVSVHIKLWVLL